MSDHHIQTIALNADGAHYRYVALQRSQTTLPRVGVGAFTPIDAPGAPRILFMASMDLETARAYAEAILAACEMAEEDLIESKSHPKQ